MNQEYNAADPRRYQRGYRETIAPVNRGIVVCEETVPFSGNLSKQKGSGGYLNRRVELIFKMKYFFLEHVVGL